MHPADRRVMARRAAPVRDAADPNTDWVAIWLRVSANILISLARALHEIRPGTGRLTERMMDHLQEARPLHWCVHEGRTFAVHVMRALGEIGEILEYLEDELPRIEGAWTTVQDYCDFYCRRAQVYLEFSTRAVDMHNQTMLAENDDDGSTAGWMAEAQTWDRDVRIAEQYMNAAHVMLIMFRSDGIVREDRPVPEDVLPGALRREDDGVFRESDSDPDI